ncbi:MAG: hypothetical protein D5S00_10580 [Tindallia sp. MSAO_Bac2]|nr:MAG: hypothetical protein D5S00_10580 [Tindallia sp. MSAO_Bac2]
MVSWKTKIITIGLVSLLTLCSLAQNALARDYLYESRKSNTIGSGVVHDNILRFGESGWLHMNVVKVDLNNDKSEIDLIQSSSGVSQRETLGKMLEQKTHPIAAINADYFYVTNPDSPLGVMIRKGQLISDPGTAQDFSSVIITKEMKAAINSLQNRSFITTENDIILSVGAYNRINWNYASITVLDSNWGSKTPGAAGEYSDLVEVIVKDDIVSEIRQSLPSTDIPHNGYAIIASGENGKRLKSSFNLGERVKVHPQTAPSLEGIHLAVGGGTPILRNGQVLPPSRHTNGSQPRTAIGINREGNQLIMATVDGRHHSYQGVNGEVMARLMMEAGSYDAIMMDGGGSTTMMIRNPGEAIPHLANVPSDGSQRRIINALAISPNPESGDNIGGIVLEAPQSNLFKNNGIPLNIKGYDESYRPIAINNSDVSYRILEGSGRVEDGKLIPEESGKLVVEASFQDFREQKEFRILEDVAAIQINAPVYKLGHNERLELAVEGIDFRGNRALLDFDRVQWTDEKGAGTFRNGYYMSGEWDGATVLRAAYNGHAAAIPVAVGSQRSAMPNLDNFKPEFIGYPDAVKGNVRIASEGKVNNSSLELTYDFTESTETTAAYISFGTNLALPSGTREISIWAHAKETAPHWIRAQVKDGQGNNHVLDLKRGIDWTGWQQLKGNLPNNISSPINLERIYVVEPEPFFKTKGTLKFDGLEATAPFSLPKLSAQEAGGRIQDAKNKEPEKIDERWTILHDNTLRQNGQDLLTHSQGYGTQQSGQQTFILLNNSNDGLRRTNYQQWPWLKNLLSGNMSQNVIVIMPKPIWGPLGFSDELEANLFNEQLKNLAENGKNVYVFFGNGSVGTEMRDGIRYIGMGNDAGREVHLYRSGDEVFYKVKEQQEIGGHQEGLDGILFGVGLQHYTINGEKVLMDASPYIKDGRTMVPVRYVSAALGIPDENVHWDGETETVSIRTNEGILLQVVIGSTQLKSEEKVMEMDTTAEIRQGRTFVPISRFAQMMDVSYTWDGSDQTVMFYSSPSSN